MKTLYLDCSMGAAGDMLTAALLELLPDPQRFINHLNSLGIPGVAIKQERVTKCGFVGTGITVAVNGEEENEHGHSHDHHHSGMEDIHHIVSHLVGLPSRTVSDIMNVYEMIAEAESRVHGVPVKQIHFHEVGSLDAVADITAVCLLINEIAPEEIVVSPIHVGSGHVQCAHGTLPVPAPATAVLLQNIPIYGGEIRGELCTPTGAALVRYFATRFGDMPTMSVGKIGYGMGKRDFQTANCVRAMLGETADGTTDSVVELSCNLDDMTGEEIGFATERFFEGGALEVYTVPVGMKKSRPGILLRVICKPCDKDETVRRFFRYTTTIGVRETVLKRYVLDRKIAPVQTEYGEVRRKDTSGYGAVKTKYEYEDVSRIAREQGIGLSQAKQAIDQTKQK